MTATLVHARIVDALTAAGLPFTVGQTAKAGPVVLVPMPALQLLETTCVPPVGTWTVELLLIPPGPGTREATLALVDQLVEALYPAGALSGGPQPVSYGDADLDAYTLTVTLEE